MTDGELRREADEWRHRASDLLNESDLIGLLAARGRVILTGSYAYNLMMSPDVDLHVVSPALTRSDAVGMLEVVVDHGWWNTYTFGDYVDERFRSAIHGQAPRGYHLKLGTTSAGLAWNVDAWILDADRYTGDVWASRVADTTERQRSAILRVKEARQRGRFRASGVEIYTAVIEDSVASVEEFVDWVARQARLPDHGPRS